MPSANVASKETEREAPATDANPFFSHPGIKSTSATINGCGYPADDCAQNR